MVTHFYVNLPVADLDRSVAFFTALGFAFDPKYASEHGVGMIVTDGVSVMLLTKPFFMTLSHGKQVADATQQVQTLLCLALESREAVDFMAAKALAEGGSLPEEPEDHGFMYQHGFEDLDGHGWGLVCARRAPG